MQGPFGAQLLATQSRPLGPDPLCLLNCTTDQKRRGRISWKVESFLKWVSYPSMKIPSSFKIGRWLILCNLKSFCKSLGMEMASQPQRWSESFLKQDDTFAVNAISSREQKQLKLVLDSVWNLNPTKSLQVVLSALESWKEVSLREQTVKCRKHNSFRQGAPLACTEVPEGEK